VRARYKSWKTRAIRYSSPLPFERQTYLTYSHDCACRPGLIKRSKYLESAMRPLSRPHLPRTITTAFRSGRHHGLDGT
jgi:hypothetical protein